jgi:hypothetical protein
MRSRWRWSAMMLRCLRALKDGRANLLNRLAGYRYGALGAYLQARPLLERALAIRERALGPDHSDMATARGNLASLVRGGQS